MPLTVPSLDDRTYADLVREGIELIPRYARRWTNHNASDPGITFLELFAYVTEIFLYRLDRVSDDNKRKFLKLLTGEEPPDQSHQDLEGKIRECVLELRRPFRAITCEDFERLAYEASGRESMNHAVRRAHCFPRWNLEALTEADRRRDRPGHISIVFVPENPWAEDETVQAIRGRIKKYLEPRRLLTSKVHVVGPSYVDLGLQIAVALLPGFGRSGVVKSIKEDLERFFDPLRGGPQGSGWPFGRSVYVSDVYRRLEAVNGVDHVTAVKFDVADATRLGRNELGEIGEARLRAEELVRVQVSEISFEHSG
jgi:Baseplate J-like protein